MYESLITVIKTKRINQKSFQLFRMLALDQIQRLCFRQKKASFKNFKQTQKNITEDNAGSMPSLLSKTCNLRNINQALI